MIDPRDAGPLFVTGTVFRVTFCCYAGTGEAVPGLSPQEPLSPKAPSRKNLNTGRNASNSRFFSDCYSRRKSGETGHSMELSDAARLPQSNRGRRFRNPA